MVYCERDKLLPATQANISRTMWRLRQNGAHGSGPQVVSVTVPTGAARAFDYLGRIDAIGEAWWAPIGTLRGATVGIPRSGSGSDSMTHGAIVHWLSPNQRERMELPSTLRYVALSRFKQNSDTWPDGAWSVELRFETPPSEQATRESSNAAVRFLFDTAPQEWLSPGVRFAIYEGRQRVGEVEVLD